MPNLTYKQEVALNNYNLIHDKTYWLLEHMADIEEQQRSSLYYNHIPDTVESQNLTEIDEDLYPNISKLIKRINELEKEIKDTGKTLNHIYNSLTEGSDLRAKVQAMKPSKPDEDVKKKETDDLLSRARKLKI